MVSKSIFSSLGKNEVFSHMHSEAANLFSFQFTRRIIGPNKDDCDQHLRMRFLICNLYVKRRMIPFSDFFNAIFTCESVSKKFVLSK